MKTPLDTGACEIVAMDAMSEVFHDVELGGVHIRRATALCF